MSAITKHRVCTSTLYPLVDKCVCKLSLVMPQYYYIWFCSVTIEQSHKSHTACVPYPTTFNIQNKNAHIFVLNGVLCDMGHVHCGIYENCLFIISSGSASCHHAPDLYLVAQQIWTESDNFDFFSRGRGLGEGAVSQALRQRHLCGTERAGHSTEQQNMLRGNFFSFQLIQTKFGVPTGQ